MTTTPDEIISDRDFDPHDHRIVENPTTNFEIFGHIVKSMLGTGILALPHAFMNSGWIVGFVGTFIIAITVSLMTRIIIKAQYLVCKRAQVGYMTYAEALQYSFKNGPEVTRGQTKTISALTNIVLIAFQIGTCAIYIDTISRNTSHLIEDFNLDINRETIILIVFVPIAILNVIKTFKLLTPLSQLGNVLLISSTVAIFIWLVIDIPNVKGLVQLGTLEGLCLYYGTSLFALAAVGLIVHIESFSEHPKQFTMWRGPMNCAFFIIAILYAFFGLFGYFKYGANVQATIPLNLPEEMLWAKIVETCVILAIICSYPLQSLIPIDYINSFVAHQIENQKILQMFDIFLRISLVGFSCFVAIVTPDLGVLISLVGSLCIPMIAFILPAILDYYAHWPNNFGKYYHVIIRDFFIIIFGLAAFACCSYVGIQEMIQKNSNATVAIERDLNKIYKSIQLVFDK